MFTLGSKGIIYVLAASGTCAEEYVQKLESAPQHALVKEFVGQESFCFGSCCYLLPSNTKRQPPPT